MELEVRRGNEHPNAKLTPAKVRQIRKLHEAGKNYQQIAKKMGVSDRTIGQVVRKQRWTHV